MKNKKRQLQLVEQNLNDYKLRLRKVIVEANKNPMSFEAIHRETLVKKYNGKVRELTQRLDKIKALSN